jgi:hypothetical protein
MRYFFKTALLNAEGISGSFRGVLRHVAKIVTGVHRKVGHVTTGFTLFLTV